MTAQKTAARETRMAASLHTSLLVAFLVVPELCYCIHNCVKGPSLPNRPFVTVWNTPTDRCKPKWNVSLDLSAFDFVVNRDQRWCGEYIVIFYNKQLGLYPYFDRDGKAVNGGLPQVELALNYWLTFVLY